MNLAKIKASVLLVALVITATNLFAKSATVKEEELKSFTSVVSGGPIQVIIKLGNTESCRFEGDQEAIETLVSEVKGSTLIIRPQNSWKSWEKKYEGKKITAYVTIKKLNALTLSGSGSIAVTDKIKSDNGLTLTLSGSGVIKLDVNADYLNAIMSGSGVININGQATKADITLSGSGSFKGKNFQVKDLSSRLSGSGSVYITANNKIEALISGSANIYYSGSASVEKTVLGSGSVKKI